MAHTAFDITGLVATILAAVFAGIAAWFGWKAPTKKDLERVEKNTAETAERVETVRTHVASVDERQSEQYNAELMRETARRISIHVEGVSGNSSVMTLRFTTKDPNVALQRAELKNEVGLSFGHADCVPITSNQFTAGFELSVIQEWYDSATKHDLIGRRVLTIHTQLQFGKLFAERDIAALVVRSQFPLFKVEGNC